MVKGATVGKAIRKAATEARAPSLARAELLGKAVRGRLEDEEPFQDLADALGYASADSARKAFCAVQARVLAKLQLAQRRQS